MRTIFTAIFGQYDDLKEPTIVTPGWEYICFTDQHIESKTWKIIHRPMLPEGAQRTARFYKIMFHRHIETEESIWIDASFLINVNLNEWWKRFHKPFTCIGHPVRNCFYKEADICIIRKADSEYLLKKQKNVYRSIGVPEQGGLIASGILLRFMNQEVISFCDLWYQQILNFSARDQLGFCLAAWQLPIHKVINWDYRTEKEFIFSKHLHKRNA